MQVPQVRRTAVSTLAGVLAAGLMVLAPAATGPASARSAEPLNIVLLGDSYSAGNGATNDQGQPETYGPEGCYRSRVNWTEKYAAVLREHGLTVTVENHACSGGVSADVREPRSMDTASDSTPTPDGVSTIEQADAYLDQADLCNPGTFPVEEFWTYAATAVDESTIDYDCTRMLRAQASFVTPETDLVLFTMGGNDAGFSSIVTQCFILKSGDGCQGTIDDARAKLPEIKASLLEDVAAIRAAGLREDAKIVQLGYPYLQTDNDYVALGVPPYAAGDAVRSLIDDGNARLGTVASDANAGHPGQMTFVPGIPEAFAGHEPDATTPVGNPDRWINQVGDGADTSLWYHPNGLGQTAYAAVLLRGGDYGATPKGSQPPKATRTIFKAKPVKRKVAAGHVAKIRTRVRNTDRSRPRGKVLVRFPGGRKLDQTRVSANGRDVLRVQGLKPGRHRLKAVYVHKSVRAKRFVTVVVRRR